MGHGSPGKELTLDLILFQTNLGFNSFPKQPVHKIYSTMVPTKESTQDLILFEGTQIAIKYHIG